LCPIHTGGHFSIVIGGKFIWDVGVIALLLTGAQDVFMMWYLVKHRDNFIFTLACVHHGHPLSMQCQMWQTIQLLEYSNKQIGYFATFSVSDIFLNIVTDVTYFPIIPFYWNDFNRLLHYYKE
jgi:hypothetical protein